MKKLQLYLFIILITLFVLLPDSKAQSTQWSKLFGGTGDDGGESLVMTNSGEIVIAGFKSSNSVKDVLLMKTDSAGNQLWSRTFSPGINDWGRSLRQTQDGGFIIAGMTEVSPQIFDPFLIKTDSEGNLQWQQQYDYGFGDDDRGHAVWQTSDGGYIIAGQTWLIHGSFGNYDMYIIKTDMNGNVQWKKVFFRENEGGDVALAVQQLSDGGFIIGGFTQSSTWASYIIRTDSLGNAVWSNIYPGAWQSECYDIQATPDGGFILTGTETSFTTDADLLIIKLGAAGNLIWKKIYGTVDAEQGESIKQLPDGGYVIAGMSSHGAGGYDMYVVRTNSTGDSLWSRTIGGSGDDRAFSIGSVQAGAYLVSGWSWSFGQGLGDVYLVKLLDATIPVELTSFTAHREGAGVLINWTTATEVNNLGFEIQKKYGFSNWHTLGFVQGFGNTTEAHSYSFTESSASPESQSYRLKQLDYNGAFEYSPEVKIEAVMPGEFTLEQNYPNPFNPSTKIRYALSQSSIVTIQVIDILGNEIETLVSGEKPAGTYEFTWTADNLPGGVYFYRLYTIPDDGSTGNFVETRKMILLK